MAACAIDPSGGIVRPESAKCGSATRLFGGIFAGNRADNRLYLYYKHLALEMLCILCSPKNELIRAREKQGEKTFESHRARSVPESPGGDKDSGD
jgi:hypothetical protein